MSKILVGLSKMRYQPADLVAAFTHPELFGTTWSLAHDTPLPKKAGKLRIRFLELCDHYSLTNGERLMLIGSILQGDAKYIIREERHGDASKPGGLA
jgi:hypothetical protein